MPEKLKNFWFKFAKYCECARQVPTQGLLNIDIRPAVGSFASFLELRAVEFSFGIDIFFMSFTVVQIHKFLFKIVC